LPFFGLSFLHVPEERWTIRQIFGQSMNVGGGFGIPGLGIGAGLGPITYSFLLVNRKTLQMSQCSFSGGGLSVGIGPNNKSFGRGLSVGTSITGQSKTWDKFETAGGVDFSDFNGTATWVEPAGAATGTDFSAKAVLTLHKLGTTVRTKDKSNPCLVPKTDTYESLDWRDPYAFYNDQDRNYWLILSARKNTGPVTRRGCVVLYRSNDLIKWEYYGPIYEPKHTNCQECPELYRMGDNCTFRTLGSRNSEVRSTGSRIARLASGGHLATIALATGASMLRSLWRTMPAGVTTSAGYQTGRTTATLESGNGAESSQFRTKSRPH
jgi:Glycosyl hydrolases family 32 N-terminal domain